MLIDGVYIMAVVRFIFGKVNKKNEAMNSDAKLVCLFFTDGASGQLVGIWRSKGRWEGAVVAGAGERQFPIIYYNFRRARM